MSYRERSDLPNAVREIENAFIPLADGCSLAARIWLPNDAEKHPVPAILEYIPYRKRDFMRARDEPMHHYLAGHGYAAVRVDLRGSGDSDGILIDEYHSQEQADAVEVIAWLASQTWCNGNVGMTGISYLAAEYVKYLSQPGKLVCLLLIVAMLGFLGKYFDEIGW